VDRLAGCEVSNTTGWNCESTKDFIPDLTFDQMSLTDNCTNGTNPVCDANPVYGAPNTAARAEAYCKDECAERINCTGFFFQKHADGHEICGFYTDAVNLAMAIKSGGHGHSPESDYMYGAVCSLMHRTPTADSCCKNTVVYR